MVITKINGVEYEIPSSWNDITHKKYCEILSFKEEDFIAKMALFTSVPKEILNKMKLDQFFALMDIVMFLDDLESVVAFGYGYTSDVKISDEPYWKIEKCKQLLKSETPFTVSAEIVNLYTSDKDGNGGEVIDELPITKTIGKAAFFLTSCQSSKASIICQMIYPNIKARKRNPVNKFMWWCIIQKFGEGIR